MFSGRGNGIGQDFLKHRSHISKIMIHEPEALEATLSAAVGQDDNLIAELRGAFLQSADVHVASMRETAELSEWRSAALRLKSLAASFGALRLMDAAAAALASPRIDPAALRKIDRILAALAR